MTGAPAVLARKIVAAIFLLAALAGVAHGESAPRQTGFFSTTQGAASLLDQALEPVKRTYRGYRKAGIRQTKLMIIRDMGHSLPRRSDFARALTFLDETQAGTDPGF